jgi:transcriptional regulator with XRE-family HTH domain
MLNPIDIHVGGRVRMRRLMLDMSQTYVANALGLTAQLLHKYEKGTVRIGASRLRHISQILQVAVAYFFEGAPRALGLPDPPTAEVASPAYVDDFITTSDGLASTRATCTGRHCHAVRAATA